ncbi:hypothetical protein [Allonocardiopsis opalescens]|uniref:Uncharacterized protein n=1 Tax=Allonocardiopsis opalescens TaxID=1144618 RepID=A0A2T0QCS3_9ACTN|nr:hypothetical protein [Allonocardiopsis opalescens]PRY01727.1 hypothetical protein CLV72_101311 [Allonocardiopsis opalescens]
MSTAQRPVRPRRTAVRTAAPAARRRRVALAAVAGAIVLAGLIAALVGLDGAAQTAGPDPERVAELEAAEAERDRAQVGALGELAAGTREDLLPVLEGLGRVLPAPGGDGAAPAGEPAGADEVAGWQEAVDAAAEPFATPPSGSTAHNVAWGGLRSGVELLASSVSAYDEALAAEGERRERLVLLAADLRDQALRAWSVGATQLDQASIDTGHGHVHIYLPADPESGAMSADSAPEGSGALDGGDGGEPQSMPAAPGGGATTNPEGERQ